jgi:hypothetical protein
MHDDSVLVAIDAALRSPSFCGCGDTMTITVRDDAVWLECAALSAPSRLPAPVASFVRSMLHDHRFVVDIPGAAVTAVAPIPGLASAPARPGRTVPTGA